jgi:hypothetical protein
MNTDIRRKLEMAMRVRSFSRDHPDPSERFTSTLARLEDRLTRAEALITQQGTGRLAAHAATTRRAELRRDIRNRPLRHLVRIASAASREEPGLGLRFQLPHKTVSHIAFLAAARGMAAEAANRRDLFVGFGMPATFLDDLEAALKQYDQALQETHAANTARVGARADLETLTDEIMGLVRNLDAINQNRFESQPELLAGWQSARNIAWPNHAAPVSKDAKPGDGRVAPTL